jgi:hypothetical protein
MNTTTGTTGRAGRVRVEQGAKRVRAYLGGEVVADTTRPRLVWEVPSYPAYYFPVEDVRTDLMIATATVTHSPSRGDAQHFTIKAGDGGALLQQPPGAGQPQPAATPSDQRVAPPELHQQIPMGCRAGRRSRRRRPPWR